jgi:hypothetical protein
MNKYLIANKNKDQELNTSSGYPYFLGLALPSVQQLQ